jgi:ribosome-associated translation inhibitor RaiA
MILYHQARGFSLTESLRERTELRIWHGLGHLASRVLAARVMLDDVNGPHGGNDKRCSIVARLTQRRTIVARAIHRDLYTAIDLAAERIRAASERVLRRRGSRTRKGPQRPGSLWQDRASYNAPTTFTGNE